MENLLDKQGMPVMIGRVVREMMFEKINKSLDNESTRKEVRTNNIQAKIDMTQKKPRKYRLCRNTRDSINRMQLISVANQP